MFYNWLSSIQLVFTALHGMQTRSSDENSVRLSVCHTRGLWQNGRKNCPDFYIMRKIIQPSFSEKKNGWWGGGGPMYLKPIIARSTSAIALINANRKSTTRFPMNLRWSSYVAPKFSKGSQKRKTADFRVIKSHFAWRKSATKFLCVKTVSGIVHDTYKTAKINFINSGPWI